MIKLFFFNNKPIKPYNDTVSSIHLYSDKVISHRRGHAVPDSRWWLLPGNWSPRRFWEKRLVLFRAGSERDRNGGRVSAPPGGPRGQRACRGHALAPDAQAVRCCLWVIVTVKHSYGCEVTFSNLILDS